MSILIKDALILTQNEKREQLKGDIYVRKGRIEEVSGEIKEKADKVVDGSGCVAVPGFINMFSTAGKKFGEDAVREMEKNGTTTIIGEKAEGIVFLPSVSECSKDTMKEAAGRRIFISASSTRKEVFDIMKKTGKKPMEYLDSLGLLGKNTVIIGGSWVTTKEIKLLAEKGSTLCSCPVADLENGTGAICPVSEYHSSKVNVALATGDSGCLNMFEVMRAAALMQNHLYWKKDSLKPQEILDFVTVNAAKALGSDNGTISKGAAADIVLLKTNKTFKDPLDFVLWGAGPQHIETIRS